MTRNIRLKSSARRKLVELARVSQMSLGETILRVVLEDSAAG
jgi:hypothetical protein